MRVVRVLVALSGAALVLTSCGGVAGSDPQPSETVTAVQTTEEESVPSSSPEEPADDPEASTEPDESTQEPSPSTEPTTADAPEQSSAGSEPSDENAPILGEERLGKLLTLSDFFQPDQRLWDENRYDVADQRDISGISAEIRECGLQDYSEPPELELRLANNFDRFTFSVGQANASDSSKQTLVVRVEGNGGQLDIKRIPFNETASFDLAVTDVNSLIIQVYLDDEVVDCSNNGSTQAVLWGFELG